MTRRVRTIVLQGPAPQRLIGGVRRSAWSASRIRSSAFAALALLWIGCGAKTGLEVPDASRDASRDAGLDAATDANIPCIEIPIDGGDIELPLRTEVQVSRADVVFAIDTTASMGQEIEQISRNVRDRIAPAIQRRIRDSQIGVTTFADFPEGNCGQETMGDRPFRLVLPTTDDLVRVQTAMDSIALNNGSDEPESQVEALYQIATGEGIGVYVPPSLGCPTGGIGYACFRPDALPVVLMFTDAPFHNGPGPSDDRLSFPYSARDACPTVFPEPHRYSEARDALNAVGIRVIGLYSGPSGEDGLSHLTRIATDTDAVDGSGSSLVFDIGRSGERLTESVIEAVETLADVVEFDSLDTLLVDPDRTDSVDPRSFVLAVEAVRAEPMSGVRMIDAASGAFLGVRSGTTVFFRLRLRGGAVVPGVGAQRFLLEVVFRGDRRTRIGSSLVEIVVPGADGSGCEGMRVMPIPG